MRLKKTKCAGTEKSALQVHIYDQHHALKTMHFSSRKIMQLCSLSEKHKGVHKADKNE